ncbi:hypothetical protein L484_003988 [Morus notabilis]|uniref:Derlin n=1 Tax=Morus notabilis TaxID=981085 RepID=W9S5P7_9ROSA|nr:hypothetical protein L484_003988 [Morus notabilis]
MRGWGEKTEFERLELCDALVLQVTAAHKAYGTLCLLTTVGYQLGLYDKLDLALYYPYVFHRFQVWRLITTLFFLGGFSINFGIRLLMMLNGGRQDFRARLQVNSCFAGGDDILLEHFVEEIFPTIIL